MYLKQTLSKPGKPLTRRLMFDDSKCEASNDDAKADASVPDKDKDAYSVYLALIKSESPIVGQYNYSTLCVTSRLFAFPSNNRNIRVLDRFYHRTHEAFHRYYGQSIETQIDTANVIHTKDKTYKSMLGKSPNKASFALGYKYEEPIVQFVGSPANGHLIAALYSSGKVVVYVLNFGDTATDKISLAQDHALFSICRKPYSFIKFHPTNAYVLLAVGIDHTIDIWNLSSNYSTIEMIGQLKHEMPREYSPENTTVLSNIISISLSHDQKYLSSVNGPQNIRYGLTPPQPVPEAAKVHVLSDLKTWNNITVFRFHVVNPKVVPNGGQVPKSHVIATFGYEYLANELKQFRIENERQNGNGNGNASANENRDTEIEDDIHIFKFSRFISYMSGLQGSIDPPLSGTVNTPRARGEEINDQARIDGDNDKRFGARYRRNRGEFSTIADDSRYDRRYHLVIVSKLFGKAQSMVSIWELRMDTHCRGIFDMFVIQTLRIPMASPNSLIMSIEHNRYSRPYILLSSMTFDPWISVNEFREKKEFYFEKRFKTKPSDTINSKSQDYSKVDKVFPHFGVNLVEEGNESDGKKYQLDSGYSRFYIIQLHYQKAKYRLRDYSSRIVNNSINDMNMGMGMGMNRMNPENDFRGYNLVNIETIIPFFKTVYYSEDEEPHISLCVCRSLYRFIETNLWKPSPNGETKKGDKNTTKNANNEWGDFVFDKRRDTVGLWRMNIHGYRYHELYKAFCAVKTHQGLGEYVRNQQILLRGLTTSKNKKGHRGIRPSRGRIANRMNREQQQLQQKKQQQQNSLEQSKEATESKQSNESNIGKQNKQDTRTQQSKTKQNENQSTVKKSSFTKLAPYLFAPSTTPKEQNKNDRKNGTNTNNATVSTIESEHKSNPKTKAVSIPSVSAPTSIPPTMTSSMAGSMTNSMVGSIAPSANTSMPQTINENRNNDETGTVVTSSMTAITGITGTVVSTASKASAVSTTAAFGAPAHSQAGTIKSQSVNQLEFIPGSPFKRSPKKGPLGSGQGVPGNVDLGTNAANSHRRKRSEQMFYAKFDELLNGHHSRLLGKLHAKMDENYRKMETKVSQSQQQMVNFSQQQMQMRSRSNINFGNNQSDETLDNMLMSLNTLMDDIGELKKIVSNNTKEIYKNNQMSSQINSVHSMLLHEKDEISSIKDSSNAALHQMTEQVRQLKSVDFDQLELLIDNMKKMNERYVHLMQSNRKQTESVENMQNAVIKTIQNEYKREQRERMQWFEQLKNDQKQTMEKENYQRMQFLQQIDKQMKSIKNEFDINNKELIDNFNQIVNDQIIPHCNQYSVEMFRNFCNEYIVPQFREALKNVLNNVAENFTNELTKSVSFHDNKMKEQSRMDSNLIAQIVSNKVDQSVKSMETRFSEQMSNMMKEFFSQSQVNEDKRKANHESRESRFGAMQTPYTRQKSSLMTTPQSTGRNNMSGFDSDDNDNRDVFGIKDMSRRNYNSYSDNSKRRQLYPPNSSSYLMQTQQKQQKEQAQQQQQQQQQHQQSSYDPRDLQSQVSQLARQISNMEQKVDAPHSMSHSNSRSNVYRRTTQGYSHNQTQGNLNNRNNLGGNQGSNQQQTSYSLPARSMSESRFLTDNSKLYNVSPGYQRSGMWGNQTGSGASFYGDSNNNNSNNNNNNNNSNKNGNTGRGHSNGRGFELNPRKAPAMSLEQMQKQLEALQTMIQSQNNSQNESNVNSIGNIQSNNNNNNNGNKSRDDNIDETNGSIPIGQNGVNDAFKDYIIELCNRNNQRMQQPFHAIYQCLQKQRFDIIVNVIFNDYDQDIEELFNNGFSRNKNANNYCVNFTFLRSLISLFADIIDKPEMLINEYNNNERRNNIEMDERKFCSILQWISMLIENINVNDSDYEAQKFEQIVNVVNASVESYIGSFRSRNQKLRQKTFFGDGADVVVFMFVFIFFALY